MDVEGIIVYKSPYHDDTRLVVHMPRTWFHPSPTEDDRAKQKFLRRIQELRLYNR